ENPLITGRSAVRDGGVIDRAVGRPFAFRHTDAGPVGAGNGVVHKFSFGVQRTLCPAKRFGIIVLFERRPRLSTAACPLYD
ncbi:MAG TPA: hypothetical protein VFF52_29135, partial [Isosphaeraceae bacterium]|nr:hypothetical protein [Isosphaeraceae bacterium]